MGGGQWGNWAQAILAPQVLDGQLDKRGPLEMLPMRFQLEVQKKRAFARGFVPWLVKAEQGEGVFRSFPSTQAKLTNQRGLASFHPMQLDPHS